MLINFDFFDSPGQKGHVEYFLNFVSVIFSLSSVSSRFHISIFFYKITVAIEPNLTEMLIGWTLYNINCHNHFIKKFIMVSRIIMLSDWPNFSIIFIFLVKSNVRWNCYMIGKFLTWPSTKFVVFLLIQYDCQHKT